MDFNAMRYRRVTPLAILVVFVLSCCCCCLFSLVKSDTVENQNGFPEKPTVINDIDSFKAIRALHTKLDVDADGEVDDLESKTFLESDPKSKSSTAQKLRYLHQDGKDKSISVDELWNAWKNSEVYNWTVDQTIYWLVNSVELPEYSELFQQNSINGTILPRLAADSQFMAYKLGITDPSAKSKISIKAMDVVLFGPPKSGNSSKLREYIVNTIIFLAVSASVIFYSRSRASQLQLQGYKEKLDSIQKADDQISELQKELEQSLKAQEAVVTEKKNLEHQLQMHRQYSSNSLISNGESRSKRALQLGGSPEESLNGIAHDEEKYLKEIDKLESKVRALEKELKDTSDSITAKKFRASPTLRNLLKQTYNIESQYYYEKKLNLEAKAKETKLRNQKLQKKKTSLLGYYKIAQDNSIEDVWNTIVEVKEDFQKIFREIEERNERWREIEELCNCTLELVPNLTTLK